MATLFLILEGKWYLVSPSCVVLSLVNLATYLFTCYFKLLT